MTNNKKGDPKAISQGIAAANQMREEFLQRFADGKISFLELVEISKQSQFKPVERIKLKDLLGSLEGWNSDYQIEGALDHYGFAIKDSILTVRRGMKKVNAFDSLLKIPSDRWAHRPHLPENFPFEGKLLEVLGILVEDGLENKETNQAINYINNDPIDLTDEEIENLYKDNTEDEETFEDLFTEQEDDENDTIDYESIFEE